MGSIWVYSIGLIMKGKMITISGRGGMKSMWPKDKGGGSLKSGPFDRGAVKNVPDHFLKIGTLP